MWATGHKPALAHAQKHTDNDGDRSGESLF